MPESSVALAPTTPDGTPRASIVVPNYNRGDIVRETLVSLRAQGEVVIVVVDDCSPQPGTQDALRACRDEGLIDELILLEHNVGMAAALNIGVAATATEYVQLISNDDLLEPGAIAALATLLDANPAAAVACGAFQCFGASDRYYQPPDLDPWLLLYESRWPACYLLRRDVWEQLGGIPEDSLFEDWNAYLEYVEHGFEIEVLDGLVYHYRVNEGETLWKTVRAQYRRQYRILRRRHRALYRQRRQLRRSSPAPLTVKLLATPLMLFRMYRPVFMTEAIISFSRTRIGSRILGVGRESDEAV